VRSYAGERFDPRTHYLQERIDGTPVSALFLGCDGRAELLGTTGQLVGTSWLHAEGFQYAGNIGPLALTPATCDAWQALGAALAQHFDLRGLFGVDAILRDGAPWPVEVNPRYTASVEVLEAALTTSLFLLHRAVCERQFNRTPLASALAARARSGGDFFGKAILYARADVVFPRHGSWQHDPGRLRDIPQPGTHIPARQPVLTVLGRGATEAGCAAALREAAEALDRQLYG
jgi:predicted ATP-grasp superfamily ATP-dependent carboligase